ncbi:MAG TPA: DUF4157 domain-containing protein [Blastocatellia bacterium]|nr:DUF4157 domain-containing protein [Blastocatellia bacterium]
MRTITETQQQRDATPASRPPSGLILQRKCACGGSVGIDSDCKECNGERLALQRYPATRVAPHAVVAPLTLGSESKPSEPRGLEPMGHGHNFGEVGLYPRYRSKDVSASVQEPTDDRDEVAPHVATATANAQTATAPAAAAARALIVEDDAREIGPGQMHKSEFLDQMERNVCAAADAELAAAGRTAQGCPYIQNWIGFYRTRSSQHVERALRRYAPEAAGAVSAHDYIPVVGARVRQAAAVWVKSGRITGVPEELTSQSSGAGPPGAAGGALSGTAETAAGMFGGIGRTEGGIFTKAREGGATEGADAGQIQAQLGSGQSLDSGVRSRMESAFGHDFSRVRIHTDGRAAELSTNLNARAFTIGSNLAFASGEYQPGTPIGDALLAHELAHVVQQQGTRGVVAPMHQGSSEQNALEEDADLSAVGAVASLWHRPNGTLKGIGQNAMPRLRSGLRLSRCKGGGSEKAGAGLSKKSVTVNVTYLKDGSTDLATHLKKTNDVYKQADVEVKSGKEVTLDDTKSKAILGDDLILEEFTDGKNPTTEEKALIKENRTAGTITMYYVKALSQGSIGENFRRGNGQPPGFVFASPVARTWPHELGHVLLDKGTHEEADNFMAQTTDATGKDLMNEEQIKTIRSSEFVK